MPQGLKALAARKAELAALCDAQRAAVAEEVVEIQSKLRWLEIFRSLAVYLKPGLALAAPLAGYFITSGWGSRLHLPEVVKKLSGFWSIAGKLRTFYTGFKTAQSLWRSSSGAA